MTGSFDEKLSRRRLLARLGVGAGVVAAGAVLAACGGTAAVSSSAAPSSTAASPASSAAAAASASAKPAASAVASGAASASAAAPASATASAAGKVGGQAVVAWSVEPDTLLAGASLSANFNYILSFIANGLTYANQPDYAVQPDLASAWDASADGLTYKFTLRSGVTWHDGQPFTAQDVKFTYEYLAHPDFAGPAYDDIAAIDGAAAYHKSGQGGISGITVDSPTQVTIKLAAPYASFLGTTAALKMLPQHILKDVPPANAKKDPFARKPIYTGPFMVQQWNAGDSITYAANKSFFKGRPLLDTLVAKTITDQNAALNAIKSGAVQQVVGLPPDQFGSLANGGTLKTFALTGQQGAMIWLDLSNDMFADPAVRQAIGLAIDRKTIISTILQNLADDNNSIPSPLSWVYNSNLAPNQFDPAKAKQMLDGAGWAAGADGIRAKNGKKLSFKFTGLVNNNPLALAMQPMLKTVGIDIQPTVLDFGAWIGSLKPGKYEATYGSWANFRDPRADLTLNFRSPRATDMTTYKNDKVDQLFQQAQVAKSRDEEKPLYDQIQMLVQADYPYPWLWRQRDLIARDSKLVVPDFKTVPQLYQLAPQWSLA
ncbi:MAG: ABC transporter substrate-binding protein [Chloroflexi bacterium]|nr:ABC transporter substrate-binding protein [Chloroflexota bacterium]